MTRDQIRQPNPMFELDGRRAQVLLGSAEGFTLIELLVVIQVIAILVLIGVPTYLGTTAKARTAAAQANVRIAIPVAVLYFSDTVNNPTPGTFGSISGAKLRTEARGIAPNVKAGAKTVLSTNDAFCIQDTEDGGKSYYRYEGGNGGAATIVSGACPAAYSAT